LNKCAPNSARACVASRICSKKSANRAPSRLRQSGAIFVVFGMM
jgi:hypothetical protein